MSKIVVYFDAGVSPGAFLQLQIALSQPFLAHYSIEIVNRHFFLTTGWEETTSLLIFPGGRDIPYHLALQGDANERIRSYVEKGGRFLGLCAGGYYGASSIVFAQGSAEEIVGERELGFFPGIAIGPAYGNDFRCDSEAGARAVPVKWEKGSGTHFTSTLYFNGGCLFKDAVTFPSTEVIARYGDLPGEPAAVVYCKTGEGAVILSGVHPEYSPKDPFWLFLINKILT